MNEREIEGYILDGMARALWVHAYMIWATEVEPAPMLHGESWDEAAPNNKATRAASLKAAKALTELYTKANKDFGLVAAHPLASLFATVDSGRPDESGRATRADRAYGLGEDLAHLAMGTMDRHDSAVRGGIAIPHFKVVLDDDGRNISWDGGWEWEPGFGDPGRWTPNPRWGGSEIQSLLFDNMRYSVSQAKRWAQDHGLKYGSVDTTANYHRLRQFDPGDRRCRTIELGHDIKAIVCETTNPAAQGEILLLDKDPKEQARTVKLLKEVFGKPHVIIADNVGAAIANMEVHEFMLIVSEVNVLGTKTGVDFLAFVQEHYPHMVDRFVFLSDTSVRHHRRALKGAPDEFRRAVQGMSSTGTSRTQTVGPLSGPDLAAAVGGILPTIDESLGPDGRPRGRPWQGDKVFIAAIWRTLKQDHRFRGMTLEQFKRHLIAANRDRLLDLARADTSGEFDPDELAESEIVEDGDSLHFVVDRRRKHNPGGAIRNPAMMSTKAFAEIVNAELPYIVAETGAEGKPRGRFGDRKIFIAALWRQLRTHPRLHHISLDDFKRRLYEAHRARLVELARADLVQAMDHREVMDSETDVGGAQFHFVVDRTVA